MRVGLVPRLRDFFSLNLKQRDKTMKIDTFGYKKKHIAEESGIAVIMTLGFMAVILILVLSFVDLSIINRRMSENYNHLQAARMATQTAYQRALVAIDEYRGDSSKDMMKIFSYNSNVNTRSDGLDNLIETVVNGVTYYSDYDPLEGPHWQYLPIDHGADTPITARFAYAVVVDIGRIDPSSVVDSGSCGSAVLETDPTKTSFSVTGRPGRDLSELYLTSLPSSVSDYADSLCVECAGGMLEDESRWDSFDTIFTELGITDDLIKDSFRNAFVLNNLADAEAFWIDNGDLQRESGELYHRFNLARTDWDQIEVDSILSVPLAFNEATNSSDIYSIYWLKKWEDSGGFASAELRSKQIAANLIDYCDIDSSATTDSEDNPTYVGLEKCPYINEIRIYFDARVFSVLDEIGGLPETDSMRYVYQAYVNLKNIDLELVNIYNESFSDVKAEIKEISGSYKWSFDGNKEGIPINPVYTETFSDNDLSADSKICMLDIADKNYAYNSFGNLSYPKSENSEIRISSVWSEDKPNTDYTDKEDLPSEHRRIYDFQINDLKIKLTNSTDGSLYDFVYLNSNLLEIRTDVDGDTAMSSYLDYQIGDPRQNLLESDWTDSDFSTSSNGTLDSVNIVDTSSATDSDIELSNDPTTFSTAYIRNAPMESPWELGAIHRGAAWQTINLKKYRTVSLIGTGGGNEYSNGDANILDQVKMSPDNTTYGKININTNLEEVLKILFQEIYVGSDIGNSNGPGDTFGANKITSVLADQLADSALIKNGVNGGEVFFTRSQILRNDNGVPSLFDDSLGLIQTTDATQEEIIGKFINLSKAAVPDFYSIIAIGQTIKDTENGSTNAIGTYVKQITGNNSEGDEILSTQKVLTTIQWDEQEQEFRIIKYEYLDD